MDAFISQLVTSLQELFGGNAYLTVFFVSLLPMVEVRGSIPIAIGLGINPIVAYFFTAFSTALLCPLIILCLKPILKAFKKTKLFKKIALIIEDNFKSRAAGLEKKAEQRNSEALQKGKSRKRDFYKALGLFLFVMVPLPLTGLWTGSAIAAFIDLRFRYSMPAVILGNFFGAMLVMGATLLLGDKSYIILLILGLFIIIAVVSTLVTAFIRNKKAKKTAADALTSATEAGEEIKE